MIIPRVCIFGIEDAEIKSKECEIVSSYLSDENFVKIMIEDKPNIIVSIGNSWKQFPNLLNMPFYMKRRWLHYDSFDKVKVESLKFCYLDTIMNKDTKHPLITIFSSTYKSGQKIERPYRSLMKQTYKDWEWVIMDDSDDGGETYEMLRELAERDYRIRLYKDSKHSGYIGKMKRDVAMMGYGDILVELDHDDDIMDNCLEDIVKAFQSDPDVGFVYTDYTEIYENGNNFKYSERYAYGYGSYVKWLHNGKWVNAAQHPPLNQSTLRYIIGVPNHIRAWRSSVYHELGGHNPYLHVVDDYELIVRTFLKYKLMRIPKCSYIQYRNQGGNNFTFIRNGEIQKLTKMIAKHYEKKIHERLLELNMTDTTNRNTDKEWERDPVNFIGIKRGAELVYKDPNDVNTISIIMPTYNNKLELELAIQSVLDQDYKQWILYVIGDKCPILNDVMEQSKFKDSRIRWWNLESRHDVNLAVARNYALRMLLNTNFVAYLNDNHVWKNNQLSILIKAINLDNSTYQYVYNYDMENTININNVLHRKDILEQCGYWRPDEIDSESEFIKRFVHMKNKAINGSIKSKTITRDDILKLSDNTFAIATLTCNDRKTLFDTLKSFLENTNITNNIMWYIFIQGYTDEYLQILIDTIKEYEDKYNIKFNLIQNKENLGFSKGNNKLAELVKSYDMVLNLEDDWHCLPADITGLSKEWLNTSIDFLTENENVSTLFLRKYVNDKEKYQYGWSRYVNYSKHKFKNNFNYAEKMKNSQIIMYNNIKFQEIPSFLYTANPHIRKNKDYYRATVFPLNEYTDVSQRREEWKLTQYNEVSKWGQCEAEAMEKIIFLTAYNVGSGIFGHNEDLTKSGII
jgi:glycosyltransferase involved in cell wall biosynthesis